MTARAWLLGAALLGLAGCKLSDSLAAHACERDEHCSAGRFCVQYQCQDFPPFHDASLEPDVGAPAVTNDAAASGPDGPAPDARAEVGTTLAPDARPVDAPPSGCSAGEFRSGDRCMSAAVSVAASSKRTCAVLRDGTVWCWGGMLNISGPLQVQNLTDVRSVVMGGTWGESVERAFNCALTAGQQVRCWGDDSLGQLGDGDLPAKQIPSTVVTSEGRPLTGVTSLAVGRSFGCASTATTVYCWGENTQGQLAAPVGGQDGQKQVPDSSPPLYYRTFAAPAAVAAGVLAAGDNAAVGVDSAGRVCGWGWSNSGFWPHTPTPSAPACVTISGSLQVVMGWGGACARRDSAEVWCWAYDLDVFEPPGGAVAFDTTNVVAGREHLCALQTDGHVVCWGKGNQGELGNEPKPLQFNGAFPGEIVKALGTDAIAIGSGQSAMHTCAIMKDGSLRCWGRNSEGQLGNQGAGPMPGMPVPVLW